MPLALHITIQTTLHSIIWLLILASYQAYGQSWSILDVDSFNPSIASNFTCIPSIKSDSSCFNHGTCVVLFDPNTINGISLINQSSSKPESIDGLGLDLYGITDDMLPVSVCRCDHGYRVRTDIIRFNALHYRSCAISQLTVDVAMIMALMMYTILACFALFKMCQWYHTSKYTIQRLSALSLAPPKSHVARALRLSLSNHSNSQITSRSVKHVVAPVLPLHVKMVEMMSQEKRPDHPFATKPKRLRATQSDVSVVRPSSRARSSSVSSPYHSQSQSLDPIDPLAIGLFIRPTVNQSNNLSNNESNQSVPIKKSNNLAKRHQTEKPRIIKPGLPPITKGALWKKYCLQLQFLIPLMCFVTGLSGMIFYITYLATDLVMMEDWLLSFIYYMILVVGFGYLSLSSYNSVKLRASVTSGPAHLTVRAARRGRRFIIGLVILQTITATLVFFATSPSLNQDVSVALLLTLGMAPFYSLTSFSVYNLYCTGLELTKGIDTLNEHQQEDRLRVIKSLRRHGTSIGLIGFLLFIFSNIFVGLPYLRTHRWFYLVVQAALFCGSGTARMLLLRSAQFERVQPLGPVTKPAPSQSQKKKRQSAVAPGPSSRQQMNYDEASNVRQHPPTEPQSAQ